MVAQAYWSGQTVLVPNCAPHRSLAEAVVIVTVRKASLLTQTPPAVCWGTVAVGVLDGTEEDKDVA